jgi:diketogulonate reductase-like aldo/keto reductase
VGVIAQGTTRTGGYVGRSAAEDARRADAIRFGVDCGMNLIDTAELYGGGHAEEIVGQAIRGIRDQVCVASKFNPAHNARADVILAAERSLQRLKTDYLDLFQVHWPNPAVPVAETFAALKELVKQGKIRSAGVSNFTLPELQAAEAAAAPLAVVSNQMEYNLAERTIETALLPYCQRQNVSLLAYSPFRHGLAPDEARLRDCLQPLADKYSKTVNQVILRWLLRQPGVIAVVKAASRQHLAENAAAADWQLEDTDRARLDAAFRPTYAEVPPRRVRVDCARIKNAYLSAEEAAANARDLIPAPNLVAENIRCGNLLKPIPVAPARAAGGEYDYDLIDHQVLYWGWVLARGMDAPMPVCISPLSSATAITKQEKE